MFNMSERKIYTTLDVGKFICALVILFYHYFSEHGPLPGLLDEALSLYAVAVASFMVISGFLTYKKLDTLAEYSERKGYVIKQVKRIFTIYLLWSVPYVLYSISQWNFEAVDVTFVLQQLRQWIFNSTFYTIWFMPALGLGLLFSFYLTEKLPRRLVYILSVVCYALSGLISTYSFIGSAIPGSSIFADVINTWFGGSRGWLLFAFPLLMLGRAMVKFEKKLNWKIMAALSVVFMACLVFEALILRSVAGHTGIDAAVMMIPATFCILGFLISFTLPSGNYSVFLRNISVLIFMTQRLFLTVIPHWLPRAANEWVFNDIYFGAVLVCGSTIVFSALIVLLSRKIKLFKYLF